MLRGASPEETQKLQRYILGLALLAFTATPESTLRQGCQLLPKGKAIWKVFKPDGEEASWNPESIDIAGFASAAASDFGVDQPLNQPLDFDKNLLKASIEADAKKKAAKQTSNESPIDVISKLIDALKVSANGKKLNDAPLKKLSDCLDTVAEDSLRSLIDSLKSTITSADAPAAKISKMKEVIASSKNADQESSAQTSPAAQESTDGSVL